MWRYALTAIVTLSLIGVGSVYFVRGQTWLGIVFAGIAVLRLGAIVSSGRPRKPQPAIRLNLDGDATGADGSEERKGPSGL